MSTVKNCSPSTGKDASTFAKTCNRLSSFLKDKRSLKDLRIDENFDVKGKQEILSLGTEKKAMATVDLLGNMKSTGNAINHLPRYVSLHSFCNLEDSTNKSGSDEPVESTESKSGQMTILYGGQVIVFDYVSSDKARDLMLAVTGASSSDNRIQNRIQPAFESQASISDLPIARRASLHRFLAKRKDRATATAPYQLHNPLMVDESPNYYKFDLNL